MDKLLGNRFLVASALTYEFSKNSSQTLDYDFFSFHDDIVRAVNADWVSKNLDRRSIAVGTDFYMHVWDILGGKVLGWKEMIYISTGVYSQMVVDLVKPTSALVASPDRNFDFVSDLNRKGCALTFLNNDCLQAFEAHVLTHPEYQFTGDYTVIEVEELEAMTDPHFDLVHMHSPDLTLNPELIDKIVDTTNSGGAIYIPGANENMRLYSPDYYLEPLYDMYEALDDRTDITSYHIPYAIGFQILVKK